MDVEGALRIILTLAAVALALVAIWGIRSIVRSVSDIAEAVTGMRARIMPMLDKADVTLDAVNAELLRIDAIVTQAEGVGEAVSTAREFIRSPVNRAAQSVVRIARSLSRR